MYRIFDSVFTLMKLKKYNEFAVGKKICIYTHTYIIHMKYNLYVYLMGKINIKSMLYC